MLKKLFAKKKVACPYCYVAFEPNRFAFRCTGQHQPGRPQCPQVPDPELRKHFQDDSPHYPVIADEDGEPVLAKNEAVCPACQCVSSRRICSNCHSFMPRDLDADSPLFGLVGERQSGKTVLLTVLHKQLINNIPRRFGCSVTNHNPESGLARELQRFETTMTGGSRQLPGQTSANVKNRAPAVYEWTRRDGASRRHGTIFSFYDNAGENLHSQQSMMNQRYLNVANGVIILLDPFSFPANRQLAAEKGVTVNPQETPEGVVNAITQTIRDAHNIDRRKLINLPVAVVIAKIDAFMHQIPENNPLKSPESMTPYFDQGESQSIHDHLASMVAQWRGDNLLMTLQQNYSNFRLFGVSALGAEPDYRKARLQSQGLQPHRVTDPLLWLMAEKRIIPQEK